MKRLFFLALGIFVVGTSNFMMAGLLPQIGRTIGQPISVTSQGITAFSLTYLFSAPLFSVLLANRPAKRTLQLALAIFLLGNLITLSSESLAFFLAGRALTGLGAGIFNPLCVGLAMQLGAHAAKGKVLSFIWGANSAGVVFGVPLGIHLSLKWGWQFSIGAFATLALVTLIGFSLQRAHVAVSTTTSMKDRLRLLTDTRVLSIIGITSLTSLASLGLYSYVAPIQAGAPHSLTISLFAWGLGAFIGSSTVGFFVDRVREPRAVMAVILLGLMLSFVSIPLTKDLPVLGLISFFLWGAFGWATTTPQQHALFEIHETQRTILSALNSSAIGLGSSLGTAMGGIMMASGFNPTRLPFLAAAVLAGVIICQLMLNRNLPARSLSRG